MSNLDIDNQRSAGIILKGESILLMYRKNNNKEYYILPGGHMQQNETPEETCIREIKEEASIEVQKLRPAFKIRDLIKDRIDYYYLCEFKSGDVQLGGEEAEINSPKDTYGLEWVDFKDIATTNIWPKGVKEWILETLIEKKRLL